jgi:hypothetical protein
MNGTQARRGRAAAPRRPSTARAALLGALLCAVAPSARAETAAADVLFQQAKKLAAEGNMAEACPKFHASYEIDKQLGVLLNVADCEEKLGRVATAWGLWGEALEWAKRAADPRLGYVQERRSAVEPRLPWLTIVVSHPVATLQIFRDEVPVPPPSFGVALPLDPGAHSVIVRRGTQLLQQLPLTASEQQRAELPLDLAAIDAAVPAPKQLPPSGDHGGGAPAVSGAPAPVPAAEGTGDSQRLAGWIVGGTGAAAVLVAGALEIAALVKKGQADADDSCVNKFCSPAGLEAADAAKSYADVGQWLGIAGLGALAVGATLLLTAPAADPGPPAAARLELGPWLGPGLAGITVRGAL